MFAPVNVLNIPIPPLPYVVPPEGFTIDVTPLVAPLLPAPPPPPADAVPPPVPPLNP